MPLFITPGQLASRAFLYQQLSQLTNAGLTLQASVELQHRSPPARSLRRALATVLTELQRGATFTDALQSASRWVPAFDIALLNAGEQSGRLPISFALLADHYETSARLMRQTISALIYPALLFHMAVLTLNVPRLAQSWDFFEFGMHILVILIPAYAVVIAAAWLMNGQEHGQFAAGIEGVLHRVPILGKARRNLALARLSSALEALISAGVPILQAWELAGTACGSPALHRAIGRWKPQFEHGVTPADALRESPEFPEVFTNLYLTGELTGSLDDTLRRLRTYHQEEGARQMRAMATWTPRIIYFAIMLVVAWQVIRFWLGYFDSINKVFSF